MKHEDISEKIKKYIMEIPSLPVSSGKVLELCNNVFVNPSDLNKVISLDPVLTGRLLKLINSAYYGLSSPVTSLVKAIIMLGLNTVKNLVLSTAVLSTLPKNKDVGGINMEGFWHHCLCVGVTSRLLAVKQGIDTKHLDEYFAAGLIHDIGKIPLNAVLSSEYIEMVAAAERMNEPLLVAENKNLGIDHCVAGEMIARAWKLDSSITDVIAHHHNINEYTGKNLNILCNVSIANYYALIYDVGFAGDKKPVRPDQYIWDSIGLDDDIFTDIMEKLYSEIERAKIFLHIS